MPNVNFEKTKDHKYRIIVANVHAGYVWRSDPCDVDPCDIDPMSKDHDWTACGVSRESRWYGATRKAATAKILCRMAYKDAPFLISDSERVPTEFFSRCYNWHNEKLGLVSSGSRLVSDVIADLRIELGKWWRQESKRFNVILDESDRNTGKTRLVLDAGTAGIAPFPVNPLSGKWENQWAWRVRWPSNQRLIVSVARGGNEGHYIHIESCGKEEDKHGTHFPRLWILVKTFLGADHAWAVARKISDLLDN